MLDGQCRGADVGHAGRTATIPVLGLVHRRRQHWNPRRDISMQPATGDPSAGLLEAGLALLSSEISSTSPPARLAQQPHLRACWFIGMLERVGERLLDEAVDGHLDTLVQMVWVAFKVPVRPPVPPPQPVRSACRFRPGRLRFKRLSTSAFAQYAEQPAHL